MIEQAVQQILEHTRGMIQFRLETVGAGPQYIYAKFYDCGTRRVYGACGDNFAEAVEKAVQKFEERD